MSERHLALELAQLQQRLQSLGLRLTGRNGQRPVAGHRQLRRQALRSVTSSYEKFKTLES